MTAAEPQSLMSSNNSLFLSQNGACHSSQLTTGKRSTGSIWRSHKPSTGLHCESDRVQKWSSKRAVHLGRISL